MLNKSCDKVMSIFLERCEVFEVAGAERTLPKLTDTSSKSNDTFKLDHHAEQQHQNDELRFGYLQKLVMVKYANYVYFGSQLKHLELKDIELRLPFWQYLMNCDLTKVENLIFDHVACRHMVYDRDNDILNKNEADMIEDEIIPKICKKLLNIKRFTCVQFEFETCIDNWSSLSIIDYLSNSRSDVCLDYIKYDLMFGEKWISSFGFNSIKHATLCILEQREGNTKSLINALMVHTNAAQNNNHKIIVETLEIISPVAMDDDDKLASLSTILKILSQAHESSLKQLIIKVYTRSDYQSLINFLQLLNDFDQIQTKRSLKINIDINMNFCEPPMSQPKWPQDYNLPETTSIKKILQLMAKLKDDCNCSDNIDSRLYEMSIKFHAFNKNDWTDSTDDAWFAQLYQVLNDLQFEQKNTPVISMAHPDSISVFEGTADGKNKMMFVVGECFFPLTGFVAVTYPGICIDSVITQVISHEKESESIMTRVQRLHPILRRYMFD